MTGDYTPAQKQALFRKVVSLSSLINFGGNLLASRVDAEELKYSTHLILKLGVALDEAMRWSFSRFNSGVMEFNV